MTLALFFLGLLPMTAKARIQHSQRANVLFKDQLPCPATAAGNGCHIKRTVNPLVIDKVNS